MSKIEVCQGWGDKVSTGGRGGPSNHVRPEAIKMTLKVSTHGSPHEDGMGTPRTCIEAFVTLRALDVPPPARVAPGAQQQH